MIRRRPLPGESLELYSPIGLEPVDSLTGKKPLGRLRVVLDILDEQGRWRETDIKETRTPAEFIAYPGLGRSAVPTDPPRRYRVRIQAEFYMPFYTKTPGGTQDGIVFSAFPYNDAVPPVDYPPNTTFPDYLRKVLRKVILMPAPNYPFSNQILVLRGRVVNLLGEPIVGATVSWRNTETTLSAGGDVKLPTASAHPPGEFSLPIRPTHPDHLIKPQDIDAFDPRSTKTGKITVTIPQAVKKSQTIKIATP